MVKRSVLALVITILVVCFALAGWAQKKGGDNDDNLRRKTVYSFEDDTITGNLLKPDATIIDSLKSSKYSSLIKIRKNFIPEIIKSAEDI